MPRQRLNDESAIARSILDEIIEETEREDFGLSESEKISISKRKGGKARATALTPERRKEIAQKAAKARWTQSG